MITHLPNSQNNFKTFKKNYKGTRLNNEAKGLENYTTKSRLGLVISCQSPDSFLRCMKGKV